MITRRSFIKFLAAILPASMLPTITAAKVKPKVWSEGPCLNLTNPSAKAVGIVRNIQGYQADLNRLYSNSLNKIVFNNKDYGVVVLNDRSSEHHGNTMKMKWRL